MDAATIIEALGGDKAVATATGAAENTVVHWRRRDSIPSEHWYALLGLAGDRVNEISFALIRLAAAKRSRSSGLEMACAKHLPNAPEGQPA